MKVPLLQGFLIHHPLHPLLVHFPIGLFAFSFLLDLGSLLAKPAPALVSGAYYTMLFGIIMAIFAAIPGVVDWTDIRDDRLAKKTATAHAWLNVTALVLYMMNAWIRSHEMNASQTAWLPFLFSFVGIVLISISGYLGGTLIYDEGIGVGRHRRYNQTPQCTVQASPYSSTGNGMHSFKVGETTELCEGETLRVEAGGFVLAVVKASGEFYAFQEFCTHRYGPLSEGILCGFEIECPWHRSRFDVRSGEVTQGPAAVSLKTFPVRVEGTDIIVSVPSDA